MKNILFLLALILAFFALVDMTNIITATIIVISIIIYFTPSILGENKKNSMSILMLNLFLGWTLIGWVVSLVWAVSKDNPNKIAIINNKTPIEKLKLLKELYDNGALTKEEFNSQKSNILKN